MRSFIDDNHVLDGASWVVSLLAKPRGKEPEHAFIIVEGLTKNDAGKEQVIFRRYDFVRDKEADAAAGYLEEKIQLVKRHEGLVVTKEYLCDADDRGDCEDLLWSMVLKDADQVQGCQGISWPISSEKAEMLHVQVLASKRKPPDYQISGEHSVFAASSSQSGHNCYTWVRSQLRQLEVPAITDDQRLDLSLGDLLVARTTRHLVPPKSESREPISGGRCALM